MTRARLCAALRAGHPAAAPGPCDAVAAMAGNAALRDRGHAPAVLSWMTGHAVASLSRLAGFDRPIGRPGDRLCERRGARDRKAAG